MLIPHYIAAYIMHAFDMTLPKAMDMVKSKRKEIEPNNGFIQQLKWFQELRDSPDLLRLLALSDEAEFEENIEGRIRYYYQRDEGKRRALKGYAAFRRKKARDKRMTELHKKWSLGEGLKEVYPLLSKDPSTVNDSTYQGLRYKYLLHCKYCKRKLFSDRNIVDHPNQWISDDYSHTTTTEIEGKGKESENKTNRYEIEEERKIASPLRDVCGIAMVEPMQWFTQENGINLAAEKGRICCPKCKYVLGWWNWAGTECECGSWAQPLFAVRKTAITKVRVGIIGNNKGKAE